MIEQRRNINLEVIPNSSEEEFNGVLYNLADQYCKLLEVDFKNDVYPHLNDKTWWEADYGQASRDGKSIGMSAKDALRCLVDIHRTYQIYKGIEQTVKELKNAGKEEITAIDAGTGTGILSIIMVSLGVDSVQAIEINEETFTVTKKFLDQLQLSDRININLGDATLINLPEFEAKKADILVSENLSGGLMDEPQYDIIHHLSNFLSPDVEIIPGEAELYVSLAQVNWEGTPAEKNNLAMRRLKECKIVSSRVKFFDVKSTVGMPNPIIDARVCLPTDCTGPINAILISTRFQINTLGEAYYLEPDTADFLGKTAAFKLSDDIYPIDGQVEVSLKYEAGRERKHLTMPVSGNKVGLIDTLLK